MPLLNKVIGDSKGIVSIEFAALAPVLFLLLLGVFELSNYARAQQKVAVAAQTLADVVAAQTSISNAATGSGSIGDLCLAASAALAPLDSTALVSQVANRWYNGAAVALYWGVKCPDIDSGYSPTDAVPAGMLTVTGDSLIEVRLAYNYHSKIFFFLPTTLPISQTAYARPRSNTNISTPAGTPL